MATAASNKQTTVPANQSTTKGNASPSGSATTQKTAVAKDAGRPTLLLDDPKLDYKGAAPDGAPYLSFLDENIPTLPQGKYGFRPLSKNEMDELESYENVVREGMPKFLAVGEALLNIREKKLWRMYCRSWGEYLEKRVGISSAYASMQASAAKVMHNLITNGEQVERPSTERQLRPLMGLTPKEQLQAWKLATVKAAGGKVTGKIVEAAVTQVLGEEVLPQNWLDRTRNKFVAAGYETDFLQPVDLGEKTWIDLLKEDSGVYVKLIDEPTLGNLGTCYAMQDREVKYQVIVNGLSISKKKLEKGGDGALSRLLDPVLSVFIHSLGALVELDGRLYEGTTLGDDFKLELKPSDSEEAADLRVALAPQEDKDATTEGE